MDLGKFEQCASEYENDKELRNALVEVFVAMIKLWITTTQTLRHASKGR
jgi:hypothetical protein